MPHLSGDVAKLAFPKLWTSLEVTLLFEHHLLELRHIAFEGKSHLRESTLQPMVLDLPCIMLVPAALWCRCYSCLLLLVGCRQGSSLMQSRTILCKVTQTFLLTLRHTVTG